MRVVFHIDEDASVRFVASAEMVDAAAGLGDVSLQRASHVVPENRFLRAAFRLIRALVRDESRAAGWTRRWNCRWIAQIIGGPRLGPFDDRSAAIAAEVEWLDENNLGGIGR